MSKINVLDPSIFNLIAAGEVVEKPASVVKELVENSIDAGARNVEIEIVDGGTRLIRVSDDGCGIDPEDFKAAFLPHATSKIKTADDLGSIFTLGFRGEALASIAAVSRVTLVSKPADADFGAKILVEGGNFGEIETTSAKNGTTITVSDLFYCVPARAKFLRKNKSEEQDITNIVSRIILAHPEINFTYIIGGKRNLSSLGSSKKDALYSVYGKEAISETIEISGERDGIIISGFIGKPTFSKANRTYQTLVVNGRYVMNLTVQTAVTNAFGDFLMKRQYPFYVIYLDIPADRTDVNVHPNKLDIKFLNPQTIYSLVFESVSRALQSLDYIKEIDGDTNAGLAFLRGNGGSHSVDKADVNLNPFSLGANTSQEKKDKLTEMVIDAVTANSSSGVRDNFGLGSKLLERISEATTGEEKKFESENYSLGGADSNKPQNLLLRQKVKICDVPTAPLQSSVQRSVQTDFARDEIRVVGKIFNTYLLIEWGDNIYFLDQHAGHERLRYDALKREYESGSIAVQPLLVPYVLTLNSEDNDYLSQNISAIRSVGFEIDEFGERTYKISAVPLIVDGIDFEKFFSMFLADKLYKNKITAADLVKDNLMQMACKSAVKGGDDLTRDEINYLLSQMQKENVVLFCPHGRPVVVRITKTEIEKWFKRIV